MVIISIRPELNIDAEIENILEKTAKKTLEIEKSEDCEVSIHLTNDDEIKELNLTYRGVDSPTDVLAFAMREGDDCDINSDILGDVVISIETAERQAKECSHGIRAELSLLIVHGILHLLGYDHAKREEADLMQEKQKKILLSLGYDLSEVKLKLETD